MKYLVDWCWLLILLSRWQHQAKATFSFPGFSSPSSYSQSSSKPLMAVLESSLQQYFAIPMGQAENYGGKNNDDKLKDATPSTFYSHGYLLPASATVGIGTILQYPPPVKGIPYGPPRPVPSGVMRPNTRHHYLRGQPPHMPLREGSHLSQFHSIKNNNYYGPSKILRTSGGKITKIIPNIHDKDISRNPNLGEYIEHNNNFNQQATPNNYTYGHQEIYSNNKNGQHLVHASYKLPHPHSNHNKVQQMVPDKGNVDPMLIQSSKNHDDIYTRSETLHSSYVAASNNKNDEFFSHKSPVIVYQSVRPPVRYYQEPRPSSTTTRLSVLKPASSVHDQFGANLQTKQDPQSVKNNQHNKGVDSLEFQLDYSRPDPVFSAVQNSDWKPINSPVVATTPTRGYSSFSPDLSLASRHVAGKPVAQTVNLSSGTKEKHHHVVYSEDIDRATHGVSLHQEQSLQVRDEEPSEEVVSAVVFVKQ